MNDSFEAAAPAVPPPAPPPPPAPRGPGLVRRSFRRLWWLIDGSRRLVLNLIFLLIVGVLLVGWLRSGPAPMLDKTMLVLNLSGPLVDQRSGNPRDRAFKQLRGEPDEQVQLRDVLRALELAAKDPKIGGVVLVLDDFAGGGLPNLREVAQALERYKKASGGKKVVAWGAGYDQRQYFLAAHADEVYVHPMGLVYVEGFGRLSNYYREAFDRLGVSANVIRAGKYKNFGEPYFAKAPSKETLESDALLYDGLWGDYTRSVEAARKLPAGSIMKSIDELPQRLAAAGGDVAKLALDTKLVDGLKTRDELRAMIIERGAKDADGKTFRQIAFGDYLGRQAPQLPSDAIGVIVAEGEISDGEAPPGAIGGRSTAELVRMARDDPRLKAIVLRVRSPGGSAFGSELVRRELELTRAAGKPVIVSMGDVAASGGYWISMAADEVIADPATLTGSIGVFAMLPTAEGLMSKLSVNTAGYGTTWLTHAYDPRRPIDARFASLVQSTIGRIYTDFTAKAAAARKTTPEKLDEVAQGRVWTGAQAKERGLVDRLGSFTDALDAAAGRAKLPAGYRTVYVEREPGRLARMLSFLGGGAVQALLPYLSEATQQAAGPLAMLPPEVRDIGRELSWLAELTERRQPFSAVVHCFCSAP
ncbi:signal peptide peptidase SppA [Aquincola sp. S2]|uniref:Signal peptide peptidase SppA n=1 Tax=Pseudaquabacterium terrae TaxID=2732868 RepID=A0ABX2EPF5_9BURK|nr:signal peptide peptidase SppA [Aquabacterium terrae]NRF70520.1 signal peptide peptidase SppA [Aquabacterium terrae]